MKTKKFISLILVFSVIMTLMVSVGRQVPISAAAVGEVDFYSQEWQMGTWAMSNMVVDGNGTKEAVSFVNENGNLEITSRGGMSHDVVWAQFPYSVNADGTLSRYDTENKLTMLDEANFDIDFRMRYDGAIWFMTQFRAGTVRIEFKDDRMTVDDGNSNYKVVRITDDDDWHDYTVSVRGRNAEGAANDSPDNIRFVRIYMDGKEVYSFHTTRYPAAYRNCRFYAVNDFEQVSHAEIESVRITNYATNVKITSHRAGDTLTAGQDITLTADAGAAAGETKNVDFYVNDIKVGSDTNNGKITTVIPGTGCDGDKTETTPAKYAEITLEKVPAGVYVVKAVCDGVESADVLLFVKNTLYAQLSATESVVRGEPINLGVTTSGYPVGVRAEYFVNGEFVGDAPVGESFSADSGELPLGTVLAYAKVYASDGSAIHTDVKTVKIMSDGSADVDFNREYMLDYTVTNDGTVSVKDGYFELNLIHSGDKVSYKDENGSVKEYTGTLGAGKYKAVVTAGNAEVYYNGQFAFAFLMPQCYDGQSIEHSGVDNFRIDSSGVKATYLHKDLGVETDVIEYLPEFGNYFSVEYDKLDLSAETLTVYDGLYEIVVNMDDTGIWVNRQPTSGELTQKYQISDTFETGYYRVTVAEGMAQIFRNNKVLGTWRSPLKAHSPMIFRRMANPSTTTFVAIKGIDDVYYHSEDFEGNIEGGFTATDYWFDETDALIEDEATEAAYNHEVVTEGGNSFVKMTGKGTYFLNAISFNTSLKWRGKFDGTDGGFSVRFREAMKGDLSDIGYDAETNRWFARNSVKTKTSTKDTDDKDGDGDTEEVIEERYLENFTEIATANGTLDDGWHDFELVLDGDKGKLLCDGVEVISAEGFSNSFGKVGFELRGTGTLAFDNVEYSGEGKATAGMSYLTDGRLDFYRNFKGQVIAAYAMSGESWYYSEDNGVTWTDAKHETAGQFLSARADNNLNLLSGKFLRVRYSGRYSYAYLYDENTYPSDTTIVSGTEYISSTAHGSMVEAPGSMDNIPFSEVPSRLMQIKSGPYKGRVIYCRGGGGEIYGTVYMYWSDDYDGIDDPAPTKAVWHPAEIQLSYFDTGVNIQESIAVDMPDGTLRYYVRTDTGHMGYFTSSDGGETWDRPLEITMENLISPLACYSIQRKGDTNTYYAFWEYDLVTANLTYLESPRNRRALAVSYDGMETWEYVGDIEEERRTASCTSRACNYGMRYLDGAVYMSYYMEDIHNKMFRIDETKIKTLKRFTAPHYRTTTYSTVRDFQDRNSVITKKNGDSYIYGSYMPTQVNGNGLIEVEIVAKAVGAGYNQSENTATLTLGNTVVTFTSGEASYDINGTEVTTGGICYEDGYLNVPIVAGIFGKYVSENDYSYTISNGPLEPYVLSEIEGVGVHRTGNEMMEGLLLSELNAESKAKNGDGIYNAMVRYADLLGFVPVTDGVKDVTGVFNRMTGLEYHSISDIEIAFNKAVEEQKAFEAAPKNYPLSVGTVYLSTETVAVPDAKGYIPNSAINRDNRYTTLVPAPEDGKTRTYTVTFDAKNTVQGLPLFIHIGGNYGVGGVVICPTEIIGTDWHSYKIVATETKNNPSLSISVYRKPLDGNEEYVSVPMVWKGAYKSGDEIMSHDSMSNATNTIRTMYDYRTAMASAPGSDPYGTVWEMKNLQVTDIAMVKGSVRTADETISVDADFRAATNNADVILAVYDSHNRMTDSAFVNLPSGEGTLHLKSDYEDGNKAVLFIWNAGENHAPMVQPIEVGSGPVN